MKKIVFELPKGKFLAEIEPFRSVGLPTDSFTHKIIPGCGATYLELVFKRNSIVIEANVPVIKGKCRFMNRDGNGRLLRKNKKIMGVYEGVSVEDIKYYLTNCKGYKKIITTPEGFEKVLTAIGSNVYSDYFLLFDECEKAIQDVDYRKAIINPINEFFKFDRKAFVSATPIIPSDERFKDFQEIIVMPTYDIKENITVNTTNNVLIHLKKILDSYKPEKSSFNRKFFIFCKSTNRIKSIIKGLKIEEDSAVYCAEDSAKKLGLNGLNNVYDDVSNNFKKFNFLTNRFFSAVDIDYEMYKCNPIIIILSDVVSIEHSAIDPLTESVQISGRFRKPNAKRGEPKVAIKKDIYHIANYNKELTSFKKEEVYAIIKDKKELHDFIVKFKPKSDVEYFNKFIKEILELNGFDYFLIDGKLNHFLVDNFINKERVKSYYKSKEGLLLVYKLTMHFNITAESGFIHYNIEDKELNKIEDTTSTISVNYWLSKKIKELKDGKREGEQEYELTFLSLFYPKQFGWIHTLGWEHSAELDYDLNKIQSKLEDRKKFKGLIPMIKFCHKKFKKGGFYTPLNIKSMLEKGISETRSYNLKPDLNLLRNAVILSNPTTRMIKGKKVYGYLIDDLLQFDDYQDFKKGGI